MATTAPESGDPQAWVSMSNLSHQNDIPPLPILPLPNVPLSGTPPVGCSLAELLNNPQHTSGITPPTVPLMIDLARGLVLKPLKPKSAVGTAHCRARKNCLKHHQRHVTMACAPLGVSKSTVGRTILIMAVMSQPKRNQGRMQPTLIWNWPQGIVSPVQIWRSWPLEWHKRDSGRGYGPLVAL